MKKIIAFTLLFLITFLLASNADAQCAMCRATAESAANDNKGIGEGLNTGIVYLMAVPYLLLATVALVFFRKRIFSAVKS